MRFASISQTGRRGLAAADGAGEFRAVWADEVDFPGDLSAVIRSGRDLVNDVGRLLLEKGAPVDMDAVRFEVPIPSPRKILCVGLNYAEHGAEAGKVVPGLVTPDYPTVFARFTTSLVAHREPLVRPQASPQFDFEGELVAVIGKGGRDIPESAALDHVLGYSCFNDGTIRDFQTRTPQWTVGKNFDGTGGFGPFFVTAGDLPPGARGIRLVTRLNGQVMQDANTDDLLFPVARLVAILSATMTLEPGDIIVTGTPAGVGVARSPQVFMKPGDICEIDIEGVGCLSNRVAAQEHQPEKQA